MKSTKHCAKCGHEKALDLFKRSKRSKDGRYSYCKACETVYRKSRSEENKAYMKAYYEANKEALAAYCVEYHKANKEARNQYSKEYYYARRMNDLESDMLSRCKSRSKNKGIAFDLTLEDIVVPDFCPVLGIEINRGGIGRKGGRPDSPSIDRIDPVKGYTKGNVRVISNRANTLKCNASVEELEAVLVDLKGISQSL